MYAVTAQQRMTLQGVDINPLVESAAGPKAAQPAPETLPHHASHSEFALNTNSNRVQSNRLPRCSTLPLSLFVLRKMRKISA